MVPQHWNLLTVCVEIRFRIQKLAITDDDLFAKQISLPAQIYEFFFFTAKIIASPSFSI